VDLRCHLFDAGDASRDKDYVTHHIQKSGCVFFRSMRNFAVITSRRLVTKVYVFNIRSVRKNAQDLGRSDDSLNWSKKKFWFVRVINSDGVLAGFSQLSKISDQLIIQSRSGWVRSISYDENIAGLFKQKDLLDGNLFMSDAGKILTSSNGGKRTHRRQVEFWCWKRVSLKIKRLLRKPKLHPKNLWSH